MSMAWEVTPDDVGTVLAAHGLDVDEDTIHDQYFDDDAQYRVEDAILYHCNMEDQIVEAMAEIEDILIEAEVIQGEKKFESPDD